ncbi:MAG: alpha/beta fold hydrolase [Thermoplasmatota archaeon]
MNKYRLHGDPPYTIAVLHGGPGAPGEMAPVAGELSGQFGVIEPFQLNMTIDGQLEELKAVLEDIGSPPVIIVGWSFGAFLGYIFSAYNPVMVSKLILVGSGAFTEHHASNIMNTRMGRLDEKDRSEVIRINERLGDPEVGEKNHLLERFAQIISRADSFDAVDHDSDLIEGRYDVFKEVWWEASEMRRSGSLLELGRRIRCPVTAIHGDFDPHPAAGVSDPLSGVLDDFRFVLLLKCGHKPWIEKYARDEFFTILNEEIGKVV